MARVFFADYESSSKLAKKNKKDKRNLAITPFLQMVLSVHHIIDYWLIGTVADVAVSCVAVVGDRWIVRPWIVEAFGADEAYE